ncbi:hypothetical protein ACJ72_07533, partial [Emergomyces africanus]
IQGTETAAESGQDNYTADQSNVIVEKGSSDHSTGRGRFKVQPTRVQKPEDICLLKEIGMEAILSRSIVRKEANMCLIHGAPRGHNPSDNAVHPDSTQPPSSTKVTETATPATPSAEPSSSNTVDSTPVATPTETDSRVQKPTQESQKDQTSASTHKDEHDSSSEPPKASTTVQQHPPNPTTTQESFFKSVNKRLHMLETNSSLSLQYIEEQSRILRDAFTKVEKRQLAKTTTFLENLNKTVLQELQEFRQQYDRVWHSVAVEFEQQRLQYRQEVFAVSSQLGILADELVFQKRITIIQSVFVLICFGVVLFSRSPIGSYLELPRVHRIVSRSPSFRSSSPTFESPSASPSPRPTSAYREDNNNNNNINNNKEISSSHRRADSVESVEDDLVMNPTIAYSPPTPPSDSEEHGLDRQGSQRSTSTLSSIDPSLAPPLVRSESSPPDLCGPREEGCGGGSPPGDPGVPSL